MGEALHRPLIDIPADPAQLRGLIAAASRASIGMSKARWSRVRSLTLAALRDLGIDMMPGRDIGGLSAAWKALADHLPTKASRHGLSRFMSRCSRRGVEPMDVGLETFEEFEAALKQKAFASTLMLSIAAPFAYGTRRLNPRRAGLRCASRWRRMGTSIRANGRSSIRATPLTSRRSYSTPLTRTNCASSTTATSARSSRAP